MFNVKILTPTYVVPFNQDLTMFYNLECDRALVTYGCEPRLLATNEEAYIEFLGEYSHLYYSSLLFKQLSLIDDKDIKAFVIEILNKVPNEFHIIAASSTGKHHPSQSNGTGGLVRHILATLYFAKELFYAYDPPAIHRDIVLGALILHDIGKAMDEPHDIVAATNLRWLARKYDNPAINALVEGVRWHMGRWATGSTDCNPLEVGQKFWPHSFTDIEQLVHLADYMASRKRVDLTKLGII